MIKCLIASHGRLASGLKNSAKLLTGLEAELAVIDAYVDDSDYTEQIRIFMAQLNGEVGVILTDIIGGSVNQKVVTEIGEHTNILVISNANLPIVLALLMNTEPLEKKVVKTLIAECQVQLVEPHKEKELTDDSFFK